MKFCRARSWVRWVLLAASAGEIDRSQVVSVTLSMLKPNAAQSILLERFGVQDSEPVLKAASDASSYEEFEALLDQMQPDTAALARRLTILTMKARGDGNGGR